MGVLGNLLPGKYSPLQPNGNGIQSVYLTAVPMDFAEVLMGVIGSEAEPIRAAAGETEREQLIIARQGQGLFKQRVMELEHRCRITLVENLTHLRASHCKPWRDSNNEERLNGENGLLLTPSVDHLFDRGFISFENDGRLIVSPVADHHSLNRMGVETDRVVNVGPFSEGQRGFLDYHRSAVLLQAVR